MPRRNSHSDEVGVDELIRLADQADLLHDDRVQQLLQVAASTSSTGVRRRIKQALEVKAAYRQRHPFEDTVSVEPIRLGTNRTGGYVGIHEDDLSKHMLVTGQTGSGKTTLFYNVMDQISVPWWAFDLKKDYRHFVTEDTSVVVLPWNEFRFNPLEPPPGVGPKRWAQVVTEVFGHATSLLSGSKNYLLKQLTQLYTRVGDDDGWPTLHQLRAAVEDENINYARKSSNYQDTVLNRLDGLLLPSEDVFTVSSGYVDPSLIDQRVVFEFDGLASDVQNFLMEVLFAYVFEYRLANGDRGDGLRHVFFLDEGKRVFSVYKERQDASGIPPIDELTAKMREFGEGLVVADQEPGKLTESIKANTYVTVLLQMSDYDQFRDVADSMDLSRRQRDVGQRLDVGEAIVQIGNAAPARVDLDDYDLDKSMTDADLEQAQKNVWTDIDSTIRETETGESTSLDGEESEKPEESGKENNLSENEIALLRDIVERPFVGISSRYEQLSSANKGHETKKSLLDAGLVEERQISAERGRKKLLQLTESGRDVAAEHGVDIPETTRGDIVHRYWQNKVKDVLETEDWDCALERDHADVAAEKDGVEIAVEIAMEERMREVDHVEQRLEDGFEHVVVVCRNDHVLSFVEDRAAESGLPGGSFSLLRFHDVVEDGSEFCEIISGF